MPACACFGAKPGPPPPEQRARPQDPDEGPAYADDEQQQQRQQAAAAERRRAAAKLRRNRAGNVERPLEPDLRRDLPTLRAAARVALTSYCAQDELEERFNDAQSSGPDAVPGNFSILNELRFVPEFYGAEECCAYMMKLISPPENFSNMDLMVLAIRGSASLEDALCDTEVQQVQLQTANAPQEFPADVRVHEQFLKQFCSLEGLIDATVHQHLIAAPSNRVLFVGHSLGASVAAIAALNYAFVFPGQVYFVGMGMPMTGNAAFQREFDRQVGMRWRVKNSRDVVPKVKLSPYYAHVGRELLIGRYDPYPDLPMFSDLPDHFATKYIASLDTFSDSWWRNIDLGAILPHRVHASMINSSYKFWHYCSSWTGHSLMMTKTAACYYYWGAGPRTPVDKKYASKFAAVAEMVDAHEDDGADEADDVSTTPPRTTPRRTTITAPLSPREGRLE